MTNSYKDLTFSFRMRLCAELYKNIPSFQKSARAKRILIALWFFIRETNHSRNKGEGIKRARRCQTNIATDRFRFHNNLEYYCFDDKA